MMPVGFGNTELGGGSKGEVPIGSGQIAQGNGNMATITSTQAGFFDVGSTWVGGVAPGVTDNVVLAHVVTVRSNITCTGITINAGGELVTNGAFTLTVNGNITPQNNNRRQIDLIAGSGIEFGNAGYTFGTPSQYPGSTPFLRIRGTSESPCFIRTVTGGTNARFTTTSNYNGLIDAEYCNFTRIGGADTNYALTTSLNSDGSIANSSLLRLINCNFDSCGQVRVTGMGAHGRFTIQNCKFTNCLGSRAFYLEGVFAKNVDATRLVDNTTADTRVSFINPKDFTVTNSVLTGFQTSTPADGDPGMTMENCLIILPDNGDPLLAGPVFRNCFAYYSDASKANKHFFEVGNYVLIDEYLIEGCIFEAAGSDSDGDTFILGTPAAGSDVDVILRDCIVLPNSGGNTSGTLISQLGNVRTFVTAENNTVFVGTGGGVAAGETYSGQAGTFKSVRGNIFWDASARGYGMYDSGTNDSVPNLVSAANLDYNAKHNLLTGTNGVGYNNLEFSSGTPGANDIVADPQFVDSTRDFLSFDVAEGGDGVAANAIARWVNGAYSPTDLITYIRAGFVPTNQNLKNASFDGGDIGAVPVGAPARSSYSSLLFLNSPYLK